MIFERFCQGGSQPAGEMWGMGLGLSVSKSFVEMLGGKIWLDSDPGKGSNFYFSFPMRTAGGGVIAEQKPNTGKK